MKKLISFCFLLVCFLSVNSQVPEAFNYQAVVRNASGEIISNTDVSLRISILQESESGSVVYSEVHKTTTNNFGLVNLVIGKGEVLTGIFSPGGWGIDKHFIKMEIDPEGGDSYVNMGISQLLSVPYAFHAQTVEEDQIDDADADPENEIQALTLSGTLLTLSNNGGTVTLPTAGNGGDNWGTQVTQTDESLNGDGSPANPLGVKQDELLPEWINIQSIPAGFADNLDNVDDADTDPSNELQNISISGIVLTLSEGGGTVELPSSGGGDNWGTQKVEPDATLDGEGTTALPLKLAQQGAISGEVLKWNGTTWLPENDLAGNSLWQQFSDKISYNLGNVGIGINDPESNLHIHSSGVFSGLSFTNDASGNTFMDGLIIGTQYQADFPANRYATIINRENTPLCLGTNNKMHLTVAADGNVGIGTVTPGSRLEVAGQVKITGGSPGVGKVLTSDTDGLASWQTPEGSLWKQSGSNVFYNLGNVGIGTDNPSNKLHLYGEPSCQLRIQAGTHDAILNLDRATIYNKALINFQTQSSTNFTMGLLGDDFRISRNPTSLDGLQINNDGSVKVSNQLLVQNNLTVTGLISMMGGSPGVGKVMTSSTDYGLASWETPDDKDWIVLPNNNMYSNVSGNVGIGTNTPTYKLDVLGNRIRVFDSSGDWIALRTDGSADFLDISYSGGSLAVQGSSAGENIVLNPSLNSKVGIRTWVPVYDLDVKGDIRATGSVYYGGTAGNTNGIAYTKPDFVFENNYHSMSTDEVENFLEREKHLPWVTSAEQEKKENGDVTDMTRMAFETLESIENLQLQLIELKNEINRLRLENNKLKTTNRLLDKRLSKLETY